MAMPMTCLRYFRVLRLERSEDNALGSTVGMSPQHLQTTTNTDDETSPYIAKATAYYIN